MDKLDYSIYLRAKGLNKNEVKAKLIEKGLDENEANYYLKKSDEIYLNQLLNNKPFKRKAKLNKGLKTLILTLLLILLIATFYGYATIGLIGLFIILSLVRFSSYRR